MKKVLGLPLSLYIISLVSGIIGAFVGIGSIVLALNVDTTIPSLRAYLAKLILTTDGTPSGSAKIVLDGSNGGARFGGDVRVDGELDIDPGHLKDDVILSEDIVNNTIQGIDIRDGTITSADIANGAIQSVDIRDGAITSADIANNTIQGIDIRDGTITSADIANNAIQGIDIRDGTITSADIANGAVDRNDLSSQIRQKIDRLVGGGGGSSSAINGNCGPANGGTYSSRPSSGLCNAGTISWVDSNAYDGTYNWRCVGSNGGSTVSCYARKRNVSPPTAVNGRCGSANGGSYTTLPSSGLCSAGTASWIDSNGNDGTYNWKCIGYNGGSTVYCSAIAAVTVCNASNVGRKNTAGKTCTKVVDKKVTNDSHCITAKRDGETWHPEHNTCWDKWKKCSSGYLREMIGQCSLFGRQQSGRQKKNPVGWYTFYKYEFR